MFNLDDLLMSEINVWWRLKALNLKNGEIDIFRFY